MRIVRRGFRSSVLRMRTASIATETPARVVGRAGAAVPGIHVAAEHDDLVLQVGAGDLGDRVVGHQVVVVELDRELDGHLDLLARLDHPNQPVVVLLGQHDLGRDLGCIL